MFKQNQIYVPSEQFLKCVISLCFLVAMSKITIPISPVPITMQTLSVLIVGYFLDKRSAFAVTFSYLILGIFLPVFSSSGFGISYLFFGYTSGYLLSFPFAAYAMSSLKNKNFYVAAFISLSIVFIPGILSLSYFIGFKASVFMGGAIFIISESFKELLLKLLIKKFNLFF